MVTPSDERVASLTELSNEAESLIDELSAAKTERESRVVLTTEGQPVAVLQNYQAYQQLLQQLTETERRLHLAEARTRIHLTDKESKCISLKQAMSQLPATSKQPK